MGRVLDICAMLGVSKRHVEHIKDRNAQLNWESLLSPEQEGLLGIARALIADPDILCIQEPVTLLRDRLAIVVLGVLRKFVEQRGVGFGDEVNFERRAKTVIYTSLSLL